MVDRISDCLRALDALYCSENASVKPAANAWLIGFQKEPIAWQVADQLLHRTDFPPNLIEPAHYFAATTLHTKLLFGFNELTDVAHRRAFRDSLLSHIHRFKNGKGAVKTRLAICVACLTVHLLGLGEWPNAIQELIQAYNSDQHTALQLMDILSYLPEENHNPRLLIPAPVRARAEQELMQSTGTILQLLLHYLAASCSVSPTHGAPAVDLISSGLLQTPNTGAGAVMLPTVTAPQRELQKKILTCFLAYVKATGHSRRHGDAIGAGVPPTALSSSSALIGHPLLLFALKLIASRVEELEQTAIDLLGCLLKNFNLPFIGGGGGQDGFRKASEWGGQDEREEGQVDGSAEGDEEDGPGSSSDARGGTEGHEYEHIYFMRFMLTRIFELVPLFDALPLPPPGEEAELDDSVAKLSRCYARLFADLGQDYLNFILHFCIGMRGFHTVGIEGQQQLQRLHATMVQHETAKLRQQQSQPTGSPAAANTQIAQVTTADVEQFVSSNQDFAYRIVQLLLKCTGHPRKEVNSNSLAFWCYLTEALTASVHHHGFSKRSGASPAASPTAAGAPLTPLQIRSAKKEVFLPIFQQLIPCLHRIMTYPPSFEPVLTKGGPDDDNEEQEEMRRARWQASDALGDVETLISYESILQTLTSEQVMGKQFQSFISSTDGQSWRELEASLYCIRSLGRRVSKALHQSRSHIGLAASFAHGGASNLHISKILDLILNPTSPLLKSAPLKYTALGVVGEYATWIRAQEAATQEAQAQQPQQQQQGGYLFKALQFVVSCLGDPLVCSAAARALMYLCKGNKDLIANARHPPFLPNLMQVYQQCCAIPVVGRGKNESGLTLQDQKEIIEGVAAVISCVHSLPAAGAIPPSPAAQPQPTEDQLPLYLQLIVKPMTDELQRILTWSQQQQPTLPSPSTPGGPTPTVAHIELPQELSALLFSNLERLSETFACLSPDLNPDKARFISCMLEMVKVHVAPLLFGLMERFGENERRMDELCRVWKWLIRTTRIAFLSTLLQPLVQHLVAAFQRYPHACFLYIFSVCINHFGAHPDFHPLVAQLLPPFLERSLQTIPTAESLQRDPDMTEDFFETCSKTLNNCPAFLYSLNILPQIIEHAVWGLSLQHKNSLSSVTHFLALFIEHGLTTEAAYKMRCGEVVPEHSKIIEQSLIRFGGAIAHQLIADLAGALPLYRLHMIRGILESLFAFCPKEICSPWFVKALESVTDTVDPTKAEFAQALASYNPLHPASNKYVWAMCERFAERCRVKDQPIE
jgi:hypothetical protein